MFSISEWKECINDLVDSDENIFISDMNEMINLDHYSFDKEFLPIPNNALRNEDKINDLVKIFYDVTLEKLYNDFGKSVDLTIVLYLGLCNGAGWAVSLSNKQYILLEVKNT